MLKDFFEQFLFFPNKDIKKTPQILNIKYEDVFIDRYHGWFIKHDETKVNSITLNKCILFFHGNAGNISFRLNYIEKFNSMGLSLLIFDYPSFGKSEGIPNENSCIECSDKFYNYLLNNKKILSKDIIFYGESIGGSIATSLANKYNIKYLIIQSSFTDIKKIINNILSFNIFMINHIGFQTLDNLKIRHKINKFNKKMKTLIIHSNDDELIDYEHAIELSQYSTLLYQCTGCHSNVIIDSDFIFNLLSFIKEIDS